MTEKYLSTTQYYDQISKDYDEVMALKRIEIVRDFVRNYCLKFHEKGVVLDFGAGTGGDTKWHLEHFEQTIFYEPSNKMAAYAKNKIDPSKTHLINFLTGEDAILTSLTRYENIDLIFSNFAVLNSIMNPLETFKVFGKIVNRNGNLVLVLHEKKSINSLLKTLVGRMMRSKKIGLESKIKTSDGSMMKVFYHKKKDICSLARTVGFTLVYDHYFNDGDFRMYHFKPDF